MSNLWYYETNINFVFVIVSGHDKTQLAVIVITLLLSLLINLVFFSLAIIRSRKIGNTNQDEDVQEKRQR
jgi:small neutral amino acid transporter SnatA (MarC family)